MDEADPPEAKQLVTSNVGKAGKFTFEPCTSATDVPPAEPHCAAKGSVSDCLTSPVTASLGPARTVIAISSAVAPTMRPLTCQRLRALNAFFIIISCFPTRRRDR